MEIRKKLILLGLFVLCLSCIYGQNKSMLLDDRFYEKIKDVAFYDEAYCAIKDKIPITEKYYHYDKDGIMIDWSAIPYFDSKTNEIKGNEIIESCSYENMISAKGFSIKKYKDKKGNLSILLEYIEGKKMKRRLRFIWDSSINDYTITENAEWP